MTSPKFLSELPIEQLQKLSEEDIAQTIEAEQLYYKHKPHTIYYLAVNGSKTRNGGLVRAVNDKSKIGGVAIACVGDEAIYADGTTSKIISGAGKACSINGESAALVGSRLENGDEIIDTPMSLFAVRIYKDQSLPEGFLSHE
ncbi:PAAR domain-containing protein [Acinetobacter pittii]|uniref:PAAR domain-containing protein n=1 Tax=Acinetobacter pittii TaxID=48296 RepID=UPI002A0878E4|nr:PAAR domain-containing protein [Acinetobacter pittii]MDX8164807.1 PAAR domain-containing protein [Acinetobacter pittii]